MTITTANDYFYCYHYYDYHYYDYYYYYRNLVTRRCVDLPVAPKCE